MGLDMYLYAKTKEGNEEQIGYWRKVNSVHGWFVRELADGVDECQEIPVPFEKLKELRDNCLTALSNRDNAEPNQGSTVNLNMDDGNALAAINKKFIEEMMNAATGNTLVDYQKDPLAPTAGFFFGSTVKDEYYYGDLAETVDIINTAIANDPQGLRQYTYQASW